MVGGRILLVFKARHAIIKFYIYIYIYITQFQKICNLNHMSNIQLS